MPLHSVIGAALTTPETRILSVFAGGLDITKDVRWSSLVVTDSGTNAKGTASLTIEKAANLLPEITDQAMLRIEDHTASGGEVFRGFIHARIPSKDPKHPTLKIMADDISALLDDIWIKNELRRPETLQARIGYFWGRTKGNFLSADLSNVASIGGTLPLQRYETVTLRQVIEMIIAQASSTADYYVDMLGKLHVFVTETNDAPFDIDADAPGAGEIAPEDLDVEYESRTYANRVYVQAATPEASRFVQNEAAIAAANGLVRTRLVQAPEVTTADMAIALGNMYLGRVKSATGRGTFTIHSPNDGWRGGQNVLVTSADHNLAAQSFRISRVTTKVLKPGSDLKRSYRVEFGGARAGSGISGQTPIIAGEASGIYMLDQLGDAIISNAASAQVGGLGPALRRYVTSGLLNSDWFAPPPGPDAPIDDETNPLPYWNKVVLNGDPIVYSVLGNTGSGRRIRMIVNSGSGSSTVYLQQVIPINASDSQAFFHNPKAFVTNTGGTTSANILASIQVQYLKNDETATGLSTANSVSLATLGVGGTTTLSIVANAGRVPSDAYFLQIQFKFSRSAAGGADTGEIEWSEVWLETGQGQVPQGAIATRTTTQAITTSTWTAIQFNETDISDPFGFHNPATNNTRFTVPTGWGGTYLLVGNAQFATSAGGTVRVIGWGLNGADPTSLRQATFANQSSIAMRMNVAVPLELAAGDYVELMVWQNSGGDLNIDTAQGAIYYIGETA